MLEGNKESSKEGKKISLHPNENHRKNLLLAVMLRIRVVADVYSRDRIASY